VRRIGKEEEEKGEEIEWKREGGGKSENSRYVGYQSGSVNGFGEGRLSKRCPLMTLVSGKSKLVALNQLAVESVRLEEVLNLPSQDNTPTTRGATCLMRESGPDVAISTAN